MRKMPYKKIEVVFTDETKELTDMLVKFGFYDNLDSLASTAVRYLIKQRKEALSLRKKHFPK